ncbi:MAG: 7TM-DISM domain-containing protein [Flavobacteriaceae bacterium]|nr:7TM-DISM domain-containing protein [Flavobacteriaceae bacterium]
MRSVLLLVSLLLCTGVYAKKKTYSADINAKSISVKSIENTILDKQAGSEFNGPNTVINPSFYNTPVDGTFYFNDTFSFSDNFFGDEENSYNLGGSAKGASDSILIQTSTIRETASDNSQILFRQGMYYGFAIMLVLLNLVCFFLFEEKPFLYYSLALASMSLLLFYSDGLFSLINIDTSESLLFTQSLLMLGAVSFGALFASKYLTLDEFFPKVKYIGFSLIGAATISLAFAWFTNNEAFGNITNIILFSVVALYFVVGVSLFSKKNYPKFFVIATFIPVLFALDFFVLNPMGVEFLATQTTHIKAAAIAEMLILTYAIMYRMQALKEENALRQAELRIFLRRQEALATRKKTERLVEEVYLENLIMHYDLDGLEIKLLQYISEGKNNAKIARKLKTNEHEIEELTKDLYEKLEISEQIQQDYRMVDAQPDYIYN